MPARQPSMGQFHLGRIINSLLLLGLLSLAPVLQADSPTTPFLRIETGMHTALIRRIDMDARERYLVTASDDKTARVWDLANGKLLQVLRPPIGPGNEGKLYAVAIAPDGETVAVGGWTSPTGTNTNIYLFDRSSGQLQRQIPGLPNVTHHLAYSADGRYLAAALGDQGIRIYRSRDGVEVGRDTGYGERSNWVEFDRAGRLVSTCLDGYIRLYDADFKLLGKRQAPGGKQPSAARFSPADDAIAVGFYDSNAVNVLSGKDLSFLYAPATPSVDNGDLSTIAWSQDGQWLYAGGRYQDKSGSYSILKWPQAGWGAYTAWPAAMNTIMDIRALAHGQLVFGAADPAFGLLDSQGRKLLEQRPYIRPYISGVNKWRPRTAAPGLTITDWYGSMKPRLNGRVLQLTPYETSRSLAITPDGKHFLLGTDWSLRLFDRQGRQQWRVPVPSVAWAVNISGDGRLAVAAFGDGTLRWYQLTDGRELMAFFLHADGRRGVRWTPEGFFDAEGGGEELIGYHLNQGPDQAGEFVKVEQLYDLFYRPDLVAQSLTDKGERVIQAEVARIGDVHKVLARGLPPELELVSSEQQGLNLILKFKIKDRGGGIGKIVYRVNSAVLDARPVGIGLPGHAPIQVSFPLVPGQNSFSVTAFNGKNQIESRPIEVNKQLAETGFKKPSLYVLALGISNYRDHALKLKYAADDAKAMATELGQRGRGLFQSVQVKPLPDDKATLSGIQAAFSELAGQIKETDVFVLFMAGHGTVLDGKYYFIPWDLIYENDTALRRGSLNQDKLQKLLAKIPARNSLVILDTCYSGTLVTASTSINLAGRAITEKTAIDRLMRATGRNILAASSNDQMALEGHEEHGVFSYALLKGLQGRADQNRDKTIETDELAAFVFKEVPAITKQRWGYEQFPMRRYESPSFPIGQIP